MKKKCIGLILVTAILSVGVGGSSPISQAGAAVHSLPPADTAWLVLEVAGESGGAGTLNVYLHNSSDVVSTFQFTLHGLTVTGASGGSAGESGFTVSMQNNNVVGFSLSGGSIEEGDGLLTELTFTGHPEGGDISIENIMLVDEDNSVVETGWHFCADLGDLDGNGSWNVLDIVSLANCVLASNCGG